jgi:hypothetical protein
VPKSEAFTLELSARMAVRACAFCIESGDDLGPFFIGFGRVNWVGGDGSLMGPFFHCGLGLFKDVKKKNFQPSFRPAVYFETPLYHLTKTKLEYRAIRRQRAVNLWDLLFCKLFESHAEKFSILPRGLDTPRSSLTKTRLKYKRKTRGKGYKSLDWPFCGLFENATSLLGIEDRVIV